MNRRTIGIASVIYGASILLSRLIGLVREAVIGRTLGGGASADVYWTAFVLPDFLNYLLAGGVLSIVFIPIFGGYLAREEEAEGWRVFSILANGLTIILVLLTTGLWFAVPWLSPIIAPGMDAAQLTELNQLIRIILPAQIFHLVGGLLSATLQARDAHGMPALAPVVYTLCIVLGGVLFAEQLGAAGFAWGVLVGSFLGPFGCPLMGCFKHGLQWSFTLNLRHPDVRRYILLSVPVMLGFSIIVLDDMLIKHFGSHLDDGVISRLQYARTLMKVPMGVFGLAAGMAAYPTIARLIAQNQPKKAFKLITDAVGLMIVLALIAQAALTVAGADMAEVIWGRSRFSMDELANIGLLTSVMSIGLWAWSAQMLVARGFYAQGNTWTPTIIGSMVAVAAYPLYRLLSEQLNATGLAVASATSVTVYIVLLFLRLQSRISGGENALPRLLALLGKMVISGLIGVGAGLGCRMVLGGWHALPRGAVAGIVAITITVSVAYALKVDQLTILGERLKSRLRSRP